MELPQRILLGGPDFFMLALDRYSLLGKGNGNICHLLIALEAEPELLREAIVNHQMANYLARLRLGRDLWTRPVWDYRKSRSFSVEQLPSLNELTSRLRIDPRSEAPLQFRLSSVNNVTTLLMSWHHALMDAHGAEMLVRSLAGETHEIQDYFPRPARTVSLQDRVKGALSARSIVFRKAAGPVASVESTTAFRDAHFELTFTCEETRQVEQIIEQHGLPYFKSAFFLAAAVFSLRSILPESAKNPPIHVPVPHDCRKRTGFRPVVGNQLTCLFFRFDQTLSFAATVTSSLSQLQEAISDRHHSLFVHFLHVCRLLSLPLYLHLLKIPSGGPISSMYFSDVGDSLSSLDRFRGAVVHGARHVAPNLSPPGVTTIFSRYQGALQVAIPYDASVIPPSKVEEMASLLRKLLLTGKE